MKLTLHTKDIGSFDIAVDPAVLKDLNEDKLSTIRGLLTADAIYIQLVDKSYLFLGKEMLKNSYMVLETEDETNLLP